MATRHCCALGFYVLILSCMLFEPAVAELRPVKSWKCMVVTPDAQPVTERAPDRTITLYEYRSPDDCSRIAEPPVGANVCRADYTKDGVTETLWRARNNRDYCRPRAENLVQELVAAGFYCASVKIEACERQSEVAAEPEPAASTQPAPQAGAASEAEPERKAEAKPAAEPEPDTGTIKTLTPAAAQSPAPAERTVSRENQLMTFFNGLFDTALAAAMADAAIPDSFSVYDQNTLTAGNGETLRFTRGTHAWETRRDRGVLVINADFEHGASFNDVFFGFTFDRSNPANAPDRHQIRYIGVVSPETSSEVVYAGEDKIIVSSKWHEEASGCYSTLTTDEYRWSNSIYGTQRVRRISEDKNPDCENDSGTSSD